MGIPKQTSTSELPDVAEFKKPKPESETWTTSINLLDKHREFIKRKELNLSSLVREILDRLILKD